MSTTSKLGADMTDEPIAMTTVPLLHYQDLVRKAAELRALLASQPAPSVEQISQAHAGEAQANLDRDALKTWWKGRDAEFKNFHHALCERFDYVHDEKDWKRDQVSLIEWIAKRLAPAATSVEQDERGAFLDWWCADVPENLREGWKERVDQCLRDGNATDRVQKAWEGFQFGVKLARAASTSANVAQRDALSAVADDIASMSADELRAEHESHRHGDIAVALRELSADVAQGAEADTLRNLLSHCWEFKTGFDKKTQQPTAIKATFKATTIASAHACDGMGAMVADFLAAAQSASGDTKP